MQITLTNTGKRYNREWIFRRFSHHFETGKAYAITGPNGSGKSTLLQVIAGAVQHNEGTIEYATSDKRPIPAGEAYRYLSFAAPYLDLVEEMSALEFLSFHAGFASLTQTKEDILHIVGLQKAAHKQIRYYSSGMKQRLKLAQAFFSDTPVLLLDEPTSNLDQEGCGLYQDLLQNFSKDRLVIISSNDPEEYAICGEIISILQYKPGQS